MEPEMFAELDEDGRVAWIWVRETAASRIRPVRDVAADLRLLPGAKVYGATLETIRDWFLARTGIGA